MKKIRAPGSVVGEFDRGSNFKIQEDSGTSLRVFFMGDMKMWFLELMKLAFDGFWGLLNTQICCQISNPLSSP